MNPPLHDRIIGVRLLPAVLPATDATAGEDTRSQIPEIRGDVAPPDLLSASCRLGESFGGTVMTPGRGASSGSGVSWITAASRPEVGQLSVRFMVEANDLSGETAPHWMVVAPVSLITITRDACASGLHKSTSMWMPHSSTGWNTVRFADRALTGHGQPDTDIRRHPSAEIRCTLSVIHTATDRRAIHSRDVAA